MPPSSTVPLHVERVVAGGDGLARADDGRVVFVPGALPGEDVQVRIVQAKKDFARAEVVEVLSPSAQRIEPPCPHLARGCGGCDWQHAHPEAQLAMKVDVMREALRRTARLPDAEVIAGGRVPAFGYRTSMRFALDASGRPALREARSNRLVVLDDCPVAHPSLSALLATVRIEGADEVSLRVSAATGAVTAWWTPRARATGLPAGTGTGERATLVEQVADVSLQVSAGAFFQSGPAAAELLVAAVRDAGGAELAGASSVVDAYGGGGLFAATVVSADAHVELVEGSAVACDDARVNLAGSDARVVCSGVEAWTPSSADVVVADPSRQGLGADAAIRLAATNAPTLVLVSCDPVAMARDTALLAGHGYRHAGTAVLDLFPQTHHVEAVTRFER
jgi:23S rRNA (uracil1939-C5)-methyltransferase